MFFKVALCIGVEHDPWLVALAISICAVGAFAIVQMFERARSTIGIQRIGWVFLTAIASGATIWCTHFVAMLAFRAGVPVTLDPALTIGSLAVAIAGTFAGVSVAAIGRDRLFGALGGCFYGLAISAMHYMGMAAYRVDGIVDWNQRYVATSILCSIVFGAAAFWTLRRKTESRYPVTLATTLIVLAIATLHFIAMTAMNIAPLSVSDTPLHPDEWRALAVATALVGAMVIAAGVFAALIDRQTRAEATRKLAHMALNDALTGLPNRAGFAAELSRRMEAAAENGVQLAMIRMNLRRFKEVNDAHGHSAGDCVLATVGGRLREATGAHQFASRLGSDEFVALTQFDDDDQLTTFVEQLDGLLKGPILADCAEFRSGARIGVAVYPRDANSADMLANNAELALSRGRSTAADGPCYYDAELDQMVRERRELAADLAGAIGRDELAIHYQVQVNASTGEVIGYEALLRWDHPTHGRVPPCIFIPLAEENGLILEIGEWVLRRACRDAVGWTHGARVAVNVSAVQLARTDLPRLIHEVLLETGLPPRRLEIELTETAIIADRERALHVLRQVKALGVGVALDDFGTGYSSLETLRAFPFDKIKLDHVFTSELEGNPQSTAIIRAVLALGSSLSIPVLAEGVETRAQLDILLGQGCEEIQGFLFGLPQPVAKIAKAKLNIASGQRPKIRKAA